MDPRSPVRVAILLNHDQDAVSWRERHARGETIDITPYGYQRAEEWFALSWSSASPEGRLIHAFRDWTVAVSGFDVIHAWRNRRMLFGADVIWTHTEREHLAVALLQRLRPRSSGVPVLAQSVWLWDRWTGYSGARRRFLTWLLRTHAVEAVHSRLNAEVSHAEVPGRLVTLLPFGTEAVSRDLPKPRSPEARPLLLAVGNDADRDWETLADAVGNLTDLDVRIASSSRAAQRVRWPSHVVRRPTSGLAELVDLYRSAAVVVVPVRANLHASGATTCIEALAARRRLVVTDAGGLSDYVAGAAALVPPGDAAALAAAIRSAVDDQVSDQSDLWLERGLTQEDYVARYVQLTRWMMGGTPWPQTVSEFAPVSPAPPPSEPPQSPPAR